VVEYPVGWAEVAKIMYTHVSKCENDKNKNEMLVSSIHNWIPPLFDS
jgi:hypothetical protein